MINNFTVYPAKPSLSNTLTTIVPSENLDCSECDRGTEYLIILIQVELL